MAELVLDLSGRGGLSDYFAGEQFEIYAKPNLIKDIGENQMAVGIFNPELRPGYLSPGTNQFYGSLLASGATTHMTSYAHDQTSGELYAGGRNNVLYKFFPAAGTANTLASGSVIQDLEVYEKNTQRSLYYVYSGTKTTITFNSVSGFTTGDWWTTGARISGLGSLTPTIVSKEVVTSSGDISYSVTVPAGLTGVSVVVFIASRTNAPTTMSLGANALTQNITNSVSTDNRVYHSSVYSRSNVSSGTATLTTTGLTSDVEAVVMVIANTANPGVTDTDFRSAISKTPISQLDSQDNALYLSMVYGRGLSFENTSLAAQTAYTSSTQTDNSGAAMWFKPDGTKMYLLGETAAGGPSTGSIYQYTLSTPWNVSTATYDSVSLNVASDITVFDTFFAISNDGTKLYMTGLASSIIRVKTLSTPWVISSAGATTNVDHSTLLTNAGLQGYSQLAFSPDGTKMYATNGDLTYSDSLTISQFNLATAWDVSTATFYGKKRLPNFSSATVGFSCSIARNGTVVLVAGGANSNIAIFGFNPLYPGDVTKLDTSIYSQFDAAAITGDHDVVFLRPDGEQFYARTQTNNTQVVSFRFGTGAVQTFTTQDPLISELEWNTRSLKLVGFSNQTDIEVGVGSLPGLGFKDNTWLSTTKEQFIRSSSKYNFIRTADNGFAYLFTGNRVHKIDGGITGGNEGQVAKDVLKFPDYFTITDAVDFRSSLYMAVHHYPVDSTVTNLNSFSGTCGIVVWTRESTRLGGIDYIELPGVREIKKIYKSPDGMIKLITINDNGMTELRRFGYNDSGGVVFPVIKKLGIGAHPQYPDGLTTYSDKVVWLANDGGVYMDKADAISKIAAVVADAATAAGKASAIRSGILFNVDTGTSPEAGRNEYVGALYAGYYNGTNNVVSFFYPFTFGINSPESAANPGNVYTGVRYVPVGSRVTRVRVYNAPITATGSGIVATIKLYFNQSTSATMPNGMTKTVTADEAKRGYVDFNIGKSYVQAVQLEFEWTGADIFMNENLYMPSAAIITYDDTVLPKSSDNG